ncbi:unnamed protein product [Discula destructiva]
MSVLQSFVSIVTGLAAVVANAAILQPLRTVASDKIVGFPQTVPSGIIGKAYVAYQPLLYVFNGCVPFPAVDASGNKNAGLTPYGFTNGHCSSNKGQIYVRSAAWRGMYVLLYAWYFPKDEVVNLVGHRHDWEGVMVWLKDPSVTTAANIAAVCPSQHGGWSCASVPALYNLLGTRPMMQYMSLPPLDHDLSSTDTVGSSQPLIAWECLTAAAQYTLNHADFGAAVVSFKDSNFTTTINDAIF